MKPGQIISRLAVFLLALSLGAASCKSERASPPHSGGASPTATPLPSSVAPSPVQPVSSPSTSTFPAATPFSNLTLTPPPGSVSLGITTWNLERFDGAGPGDTSYPTRTLEQLKKMARILLDTDPAIIGLQEIDHLSDFSNKTPFEQILEALNSVAAEKRASASPAPTWKGYVGRIGGNPQRLALAWNEEIVEPLAIGELKELRVGYTGRDKSLSLTELRFPRIPLAGRFRLRQIPRFDFTVIVLHLKAIGGGLDEGLDVNDIRRRGELEDLLFKWVLRPEAQGELQDREIVILGDLNEKSEDLVLLLDEFGSTISSRGLLVRKPEELSRERLSFFFADGKLGPPQEYTYMRNAEEGEPYGEGKFNRQDKVWIEYRNFLDHILLSGPLLERWKGDCRVVYFEKQYPLKDHVHFSDHRPLTARLVIPADYSSQ